MAGKLLVLNAGSSSLKFTVFERRAPLALKDAVCDGAILAIGQASRLELRDGRGELLLARDLGTAFSHHRALEAALLVLEERFGRAGLEAVGHRIVHGGRKFTGPVRLDAKVIAELKALSPLAPLHQPNNIAAVEAMAQLHPGMLQIACFDTAFHAHQPELATRFAIPRALHDEGVQAYGFHGLSYEYVAGQLPEVLGSVRAKGRVIIAHLGSGASLCALKAGKSIATTMRFTPLDGLMMATRPGTLDPGVLLYLLSEKKMSAEAICDLLYHRCGLLGVSGISADMRELLASEAPEAGAAIDLFVYRVSQELGGLAAVLGGLDALVFTAGTGEHAPLIRQRICEGARWLGIALDEAANQSGETLISRSKVSAWVIPTAEDLMIARHMLDLLD
jgi:acetate kinase